MDFIDARFFERLFLVCFGVSWPMNIAKAVRSKTSKGVSLPFLLICFTGYIFGIVSKLIDVRLSYTLVFYCINICMVGACVVLYFVNARRDRTLEGRQEEAGSGR